MAGPPFESVQVRTDDLPEQVKPLFSISFSNVPMISFALSSEIFWFAVAEPRGSA